MAVKFVVSDHIATVTLNRPEAMNAIDPETRLELAECGQRIRSDDDIRVVILTGAGERAFCTGADLKKTMPPKESFAQQTFSAQGGDSNFAAIQSDKPMICAINGYALGGGLELALACDIRIAADSAKFGLTEAKIGSIPGAGGTQRLPRIVGMTNALMMMLTADHIDSETALRIGLVSAVYPQQDLLAQAEAMATKIARNAPLAVRAIKRLVHRGQNIPLDAAIDAERLTWGVLRDTQDRIEGRLAFQQKRQPVYEGK